MPTLAGNKKLLKRQKLRNNEYYDMQSVFDKLYEGNQSTQKRCSAAKQWNGKHHRSFSIPWITSFISRWIHVLRIGMQSVASIIPLRKMGYSRIGVERRSSAIHPMDAPCRCGLGRQQCLLDQGHWLWCCCQQGQIPKRFMSTYITMRKSGFSVAVWSSEMPRIQRHFPQWLLYSDRPTYGWRAKLVNGKEQLTMNLIDHTISLPE